MLYSLHDDKHDCSKRRRPLPRADATIDWFGVESGEDPLHHRDSGIGIFDF